MKITGDGAKMTKLTTFIVISFSVQSNNDDGMSSKGKRSIETKSKQVMKYIITNDSKLLLYYYYYYYYYYYKNNNIRSTFFYDYFLFYFKNFKGNHTRAVIKRHESYELLQSSCVTVFNQVL